LGGALNSEIMTSSNNPALAIARWLNTVWHREPLLDPWVRDLGYGGNSGCDTMDFGVGAGSNVSANTVVTYPYAFQTQVPTAFYGNSEAPTPPMPPSGWPSGSPITVYIKGTITSHLLTVNGSTTPIAHQWIAGANAYHMYSNTPLTPATTYRVQITGSNGAGAVKRDWTFSTE
jgi:hypothetical protein